MDFGMPTLIENKNLEETADLCKELGLQFIELNMNFPMYQVPQLEETDYLKDLAERYHLYYTIHLDENLNVCDFNRLVAEAYLETVERTLNVAQKIGVPLLNMHMHAGVYITLPDRRVWLFEEYRSEYMAAIRRFRELCEKTAGNSGIKICIENTDGYQDFEKGAIDYLLQSSMFALTWDIGHSHTCDNVDEAFLMQHKDKLYHFHIHDGLGRKNHQTLGTGEVNLAQRLQIAKECGCRCVIETKTVEALRESVAWLRSTL
ncbi:MAG: sugar phosphate isomerase/epimerase [Lachnospiraceae bacterium]|nr:sugar phosphate isomerase/epimerase [Lachnospiraceae bacterium]